MPLVGWSHWRALSQVVDGHLVTQVRNEENILKAGESRDRFTALDSRPVERQVHRIERLLRGRAGGGLTTMTALSALSYYYFEDLLWRRFGKRIASGEWDIVHRLTPLSPTTPSLLAAKCRKHGVPFVLGPLNGGVPWPKGFGHALRAEREWLTYVRGAYKLLPGYAGTRRNASAILTGRATRARRSPAATREKTVYILENAVDPASLHPQEDRARHLAAQGRVRRSPHPLQGADMLIEAAAPLVRAGKVKLDLIGDGMQAQALRDQAAREGVPESVFAGWIKHEKLQERFGESDVFAFPSIREFGGAVVLEAMALGLVPIVMDYGGPGELVTPATGVLLPMASRGEIVAALRRELERLADDPGAIRAMGARARARVMKNFTWEAKVAQVLEVYDWVLGRRDKPEFAMPLGD